MEVPELTDGVVILRAHDPGDVEDMIAMATDLETVRFTTVPVPYDRRHAEQWIRDDVPSGWQDGSGFRFAVADAATGRFAANLDLRTGPPPDIGFATAPWARRRGYTARAVRLATRWGFEKAGLPVVHWSAHAGHLASWRVAHACGFTFHGELPLALPHRSELRDGWFASLRPADEPTPRVPWWPVPVLDGAGVRLRPVAEDDVPRIVEAITDPQTRHWLASMYADPFTADSARTLVRRAALDAALGQTVGWAVTAPDDDRLLAWIGVLRMLSPISPTGAEIGYWAHPDARRRGVVSAAVARVVTHAFTPVADGGLGRHRLQLGAGWDNAASRGVAERAGFRFLGHHRSDGVVGVGAERRLDDGAWYELLATDPRP